MENKYYTPAIEDIRIGYELEVEELEKPDNNPDDPHGKWWKKVTVDRAFEEEAIEFCGNSICGIWNRNEVYVRNTFRTPYLTKEQIEAEGWVFKTEYTGKFRLVFEKDNSWLAWNPEEHMITILPIDPIKEFYEHHSRYAGSCPSINEFRTITKLLGI